MALSLRRLASISAQLALQACRITNLSSLDANLQKFMKGEDDPVTQADFKIQALLVKGIGMHFPELRIIGEESQQPKDQPQFDYSQLNSNLHQQLSINSSINPSDACLWIDPIDCTRGFIDGHFQDVTVLIGLSYKNRAQLGIIGTPFELVNGKAIYNPRITIGCVKERKAYDLCNGQWSVLSKRKPNNPLIVSSSNTRCNQIQDAFSKQLGAKNILAGGSGRKIMMVARGEADAMIYLDSWTHKWDSCAGQAIIKAMGGCFTMPSGTQIQYIPGQPTENKDGMVVTTDQELHKKSINLIHQLNSRNL